MKKGKKLLINHESFAQKPILVEFEEIIAVGLPAKEVYVGWTVVGPKDPYSEPRRLEFNKDQIVNVVLTKGQKTKYLKHRGVKCPNCGSPDITGESIEVDAGGATQEISCNECPAQWQDVYTLTGVEQN